MLRNLDRMKSQPRARPPPPPPKEFTKEEVEICEEILAATDYYAMLGIKRDADGKELKKVFRKKAVKIHPDRNNAPKATEAFQMINAANSCLSDPVKRRQYDQIGNIAAFEKKEQNGGNGHNPHERSYNPEDLYRRQYFYGADNAQRSRRGPEPAKRRGPAFDEKVSP